MVAEVDLHLGRRIFRRRRILGLTQQQVAAKVGVGFQQIQKYECGASTIAAGRMFQLAEALEAPVSYFFDGLETAKDASDRALKPGAPADEVVSQDETQELIEAYYRMGQRPRRGLLALARSLHQPAVG
jgi:transcriptional regulator with XRE-family HTH domain